MRIGAGVYRPTPINPPKGPVRSAQVGSVRKLTPSSCTSKVECPIQVTVAVAPVSAQGVEIRRDHGQGDDGMLRHEPRGAEHEGAQPRDVAGPVIVGIEVAERAVDRRGRGEPGDLRDGGIATGRAR